MFLMTMRGFLACYLGAVTVVGATGASAYYELQRRHEATQVAALTPTPFVVEAPAPVVAPAQVAPAVIVEPKAVVPPLAAPVAAEPKAAAPWPKLRPHVVAQSKPRPHVTTAHAQYLPPPPPPPPPVLYRYAYPTYSAYGPYYPYYSYYYPGFGYYRTF
jgi:hypothetical protein